MAPPRSTVPVAATPSISSATPPPATRTLKPLPLSDCKTTTINQNKHQGPPEVAVLSLCAVKSPTSLRGANDLPPADTSSPTAADEPPHASAVTPTNTNPRRAGNREPQH